jgi:hypothetical protein
MKTIVPGKPLTTIPSLVSKLATHSLAKATKELQSVDRLATSYGNSAYSHNSNPGMTSDFVDLVGPHLVRTVSSLGYAEGVLGSQLSAYSDPTSISVADQIRNATRSVLLAHSSVTKAVTKMGNGPAVVQAINQVKSEAATAASQARVAAALLGVVLP